MPPLVGGYPFGMANRGGCFKIGCGGFLAFGVLVYLIGSSNGGYDSARPAPEPQAGADHGALLVECESAVKARLKYPDEAKFTSAFNVGLNGEITDRGNVSVWRSQVQAKNGFGVKSTISFICTKAGMGDVQLVMSE